MQSKNNLLVTVLVVVGIFFIFLAISFSTNVKKMEVDFNRQKALLAKENSDLKIKVEAIQNIVEEKIRAMDAVEKEKKTLERKFITLKNKNEELTSSLGKQLEELKRKNLTLKKRISNLENGDLIQKIREAIEKENNENIKIVLKNMLDKIEILKGNPSAAPSPVTPEKEKESFRDMAAESGITQNVPSKQAQEEKNGVVLSLDIKTA
jgi:cell division protein FtsB